MKGSIFEIQHFSVHDGPGIRTTVFLKGCQLKCLWCHNPESIRTQTKELAFVESKCVGCGVCFKICPHGCHRMKDGKHIIDRKTCSLCGACTHLCAGKALSMYGMELLPEEVLAEVLKDRTYYEQSGGGVTLSGGEPMLQPDFVRRFAKLAKKHGIHVAMETNGCYDFRLLNGIRENIDLFLIDWKESNEEKHKAYTGAGNQQIIQTIRQLSDAGHSILLRCPIIPGYNDRTDHFRKIAQMTREIKGIVSAELLPYHNLGLNKISKFGLEGIVDYIEPRVPDKEELKKWIAVCEKYGAKIYNKVEEEER